MNIVLGTVVFIVVGGVLLATVAIGACGGLPWQGRPKKPIPAPPHNPLRACRGCGDTYHESWGRFCPNCSGAD